jgi:hypothetical protein
MIVAVVLFLTEGITEALKSILPEPVKVRIPWPLIAGLIAFGASWAFNLRIMTAIGIPLVSPWAEYAIMAVAGARGSGWLHDLISLTQKKK